MPSGCGCLPLPGLQARPPGGWAAPLGWQVGPRGGCVAPL